MSPNWRKAGGKRGGKTRAGGKDGKDMHEMA